MVCSGVARFACGSPGQTLQCAPGHGNFRSMQPKPETGKLRVLLITPVYPPVLGGIQTLLYQALSATPNIEATVVTIKETGWEPHDRVANHRIKRLSVPQVRPLIRNALFNLGVIRASVGCQPDIVLCGHIVVSPVSWLLAKRHRAKHVLYAYGREIGSRPSLSAWALNRSDAALAISEYTRSELLKAAGGYTSTPIHVVPPGVYIPERVQRVRAARPTIVTVSRLRDWYKGHDRMLEALPYVKSRIPDVHWVVIGDGRIRPELEELAQRAGLGDTVSFLGEVSEEVKEKWLLQADVFAMPSRYPKNEPGGEGFGIVYLEAAARSLTSVASNTGAPAEVIENGRTGILVDPNDPVEIAAALSTLLLDRSYSEALGAAARQDAEVNFAWHKIGAKLEGVFRAVGVDN
ncbi:hypothetical protein CYL16_12940 [Mycobacterium sp. EPG1]|nr:hypothetical protein CYL16_12940 [Mycobacterium sp. EPG1]